MAAPTTLGQLVESGWTSRSVRDEMRDNLIVALKKDQRVFSSVRGYDDTVIPELENAVLAGHHVVLLGERGQAKTRLIRALVGLLDEEVPAVDGCPINDDPLNPHCAACRRRKAELGDELPVLWLQRDDRYGEKLATPDVSMADLVGEIDPIRVAEGRHLSDEEVLHFGLIPRSNRGVFAINELPDLAEKVQVGLFNVMEERDLQFKGYKLRLPMDVVIVATANPEDYTSRGRIVTPLKDRFNARVRTHYPRTVEVETEILELEVSLAPRGGREIRVPPFVRDIVATLSREARAAEELNQSSGVSVRVTIDNFETLIANAEKRAIRQDDNEIVPRLSDFHSVFASMAGKLEFEYGVEGDIESRVIERLLNRATKAVFDQHFEIAELQEVVEYVREGWGISVSDSMASEDYLDGVATVSGLRKAIESLGTFETPGLMAAAAEFVLEGLHLHELLGRKREGGRLSFSA
ncbi:MAG: magnesium chelatase [Proteobacteria bacterium]|nr:magnesium chelatase [Pseudomonadota bacterium]